MYHRQTSQGSEVMNAANIDIHAQTAVCPVNTAMLIIKMECRRYKMQQTSAWALENELSQHGEKEYKEVFDGIITKNSRSTLWIVAMRHGNAAL